MDVADQIYLPIWGDVLQMNVSTIADVSKSKSAMTLSGQIVVSFFKLLFSHLMKSLVSLGGKNIIVIIIIIIIIVIINGLSTYTQRLSRLHSLSYSHSLTHSLIHSLTHSLIHSLTHSLTHPLTHSRTHSLIHSPTHPPTHSLTHSRTHARAMYKSSMSMKSSQSFTPMESISAMGRVGLRAQICFRVSQVLVVDGLVVRGPFPLAVPRRRCITGAQRMRDVGRRVAQTFEESGYYGNRKNTRETCVGSRL